jgi:hypothetical protein
LEAALERANVPVNVRSGSAIHRPQQHVSACIACVHVPAEASRWGTREIRNTAQELRELFPQLAQPTQIVLLLINDRASGDLRTESKVVDMMQRLDSEAAASYGITMSINAVEVPAGVDCEALCVRMVDYFAHAETLVSGELVHFPELAHHSISQILSDRFA